MKLYPIGTVITLAEGEQELMITSRFPLYDNKGTIGYFDYAGCLFPQGQMYESNFFFNEYDIKSVEFEGYHSDEEQHLKSELEKKILTIRYPKLSVKDTY